MRAYRAIWGTSMVLATVVALFSYERLGLWNVVGASAMLAGLGAMFGLAWAAVEQRWRLIGRCTLWFAVSGLLLVGLPTVIGGWALLALPALGAGAPPLAQRALGLVNDRRPVRATSSPHRLTDADLRRRWRRTSEELHRPGTTAAAALRLVQERELLLDEIERRDPAAFETQLVQAGWHSAHPAVDL
jgi:hypothetical protein